MRTFESRALGQIEANVLSSMQHMRMIVAQKFKLTETMSRVTATDTGENHEGTGLHIHLHKNVIEGL